MTRSAPLPSRRQQWSDFRPSSGRLHMFGDDVRERLFKVGVTGGFHRHSLTQNDIAPLFSFTHGSAGVAQLFFQPGQPLMRVFRRRTATLYGSRLSVRRGSFCHAQASQKSQFRKDRQAGFIASSNSGRSGNHAAGQ